MPASQAIIAMCFWRVINSQRAAITQPVSRSPQMHHLGTSLGGPALGQSALLSFPCRLCCLVSCKSPCRALCLRPWVLGAPSPASHQSPALLAPAAEVQRVGVGVGMSDDVCARLWHRHTWALAMQPASPRSSRDSNKGVWAFSTHFPVSRGIITLLPPAR